MLAEMVLRAPRPPEPTFADLPELMAMPMLLGIGFWAPAPGGQKAGFGEENGVDAEGRASSPAPRDEGRPLPGVGFPA